jgi:hypothetical protein
LVLLEPHGRCNDRKVEWLSVSEKKHMYLAMEDDGKGTFFVIVVVELIKIKLNDS